MRVDRGAPELRRRAPGVLVRLEGSENHEHLDVHVEREKFLEKSVSGGGPSEYESARLTRGRPRGQPSTRARSPSEDKLVLVFGAVEMAAHSPWCQQPQEPDCRLSHVSRNVYLLA